MKKVWVESFPGGYRYQGVKYRASSEPVQIPEGLAATLGLKPIDAPTGKAADQESGEPLDPGQQAEGNGEETQGEEGGDASSSGEDKRTVDQLKEALTAAGVEIPKDARKADLLALAAEKGV